MHVDDGGAQLLQMIRGVKGDYEDSITHGTLPVGYNVALLLL